MNNNETTSYDVLATTHYRSYYADKTLNAMLPYCTITFVELNSD